MKMKNKALVKYEIRNIWPMLIYFMGCMIVGIYAISSDLQSDYLRYLRKGYNQTNQEYFNSALNNMDAPSIMFFGIGVVLLLYLQFRDNKSLQVSGFIKALPYTQQEVYHIKLISGLVTIMVPMFVGVIGVLSLRINVAPMLSYAQKISLLGSKIEEIDGFWQIILHLALIYGIILFMYLLGFWIQYVVNNNIVSLMISGLCLAIIPLNVSMYGEYIQRIVNVNSNMYETIETIKEALCPIFYLNTTYYEYRVSEEATKHFESELIHIIESMEIKLVILILLIMILLIVIALCNKNYKAENQEGFISIGWAEKVFKIGVIISAIGCSSVVFSEIIGTYSMGQKIIVHIMMEAIGVISYLIANKICLIGKR